MDIEENEDVDYEFLKKYIKDDEDNLKKESEGHLLLEKFEAKKSGATEVLSRAGEGYSYSDSDFKKKNAPTEDEEFDEFDERVSEDVESNTPLKEAKKEFLKHLENDSLTVDTCNQINKDCEKENNF